MIKVYRATRNISIGVTDWPCNMYSAWLRGTVSTSVQFYAGLYRAAQPCTRPHMLLSS